MSAEAKQRENGSSETVEDRIREYKKAYYIRNRDKMKARSIAYYAAHREERKEKQRKYRKEHAEEIRAKDKARRSKTRNDGNHGEPMEGCKE